MDPEVDALRAPDWSPPASWHRVSTIDAHAAGEPFRVIVDGVPEPRGETILERRRWARENIDALRRGLMWEPRGHADMYGCLLTAPIDPASDFGILFLHNEGYSTMCGHGIIAVSTVVLETGMLPAGAKGRGETGETELTIDTPAGLVTSWSRLEDGRVRSVRFENVPSWAVALDELVEVPGLGTVHYDLAFGGAYYAYVAASEVGLTCTAADCRGLIDAGVTIKRALAASRPIEHPLEPELGFLYGVVFVGPAADAAHHSRNVCVFADGEVDRSPTGTSVSARLAIHHARGELATGERIVVESILGSSFGGRVVRTTTFAGRPAVIPEVSGSAWLTGRQEHLFDPEDPFREGFLLR